MGHAPRLAARTRGDRRRSPRRSASRPDPASPRTSAGPSTAERMRQRRPRAPRRPGRRPAAGRPAGTSSAAPGTRAPAWAGSSPPSTTVGGTALSGFGRRRSAASSTWSMVSARTSLSCLRISSGMSRRSFSFLRGQDHHARAGEVRGEDLALEAADREHAAAERDLAGHRHVLADGDARERGDHRGGHGHARRRSVLGDGPGRHVDVQGVLLEHLAGDPELVGRGSGSRTGPPARTRASRRPAGR